MPAVNIKHLSMHCRVEVVNHNRQELAPQTAQAAAISNTFQDEDSASSDSDEDELLDDIGEN